MTDKLRELTLLALESHGCERLKDFYECGPVQRASVETFLEAALSQQDAQAVPQCEAIVEEFSAWLNERRGMSVAWVFHDVVAKFRAMLNAAPTPPAQQDAQLDVHPGSQEELRQWQRDGSPVPPGWPELLGNFKEGQWWVVELDAMARASTATDDQRRAVSVVHHLLASVAAAAPPAQTCGCQTWRDTAAGQHFQQATGYGVVKTHNCNAAPTPPAQPAQQDAQWDPSGLYAQGWINGTQVQSLIDWCNSGSTKRADIAFTGGPSRQIAYAIEHLVKRASNLETSEGVFVPRELLAKVANALGLPYEEEHTRLRSKLLDILSFAAPAQSVMLTDDEVIQAAVATKSAEPGRDGYILPVSFARAVIEAYERKNGISQPGYTAADMASQDASQFRSGHEAAQAEIAELEQENRLLRARNDRLQKEIEQKGEL